ncbi:MAG TPA: thioredoxin domain-containing protein, partial [Thermoleophilia bacterium]|nr:thioredoxin domain-containing protein [Thermoleophilia bacterium]
MSTHRDRDVVSGIIPWVGATALIGLAVIALYLFTGAAATRPSTAAPVAASDITFGPAGTRVTVIEYSDFQCPFCAEYATWMRQLREKYGDRVQFVFRNFPLAKHRW